MLVICAAESLRPAPSLWRSVDSSTCSRTRSSQPFPPCQTNPTWWLRIGRLQTKQIAVIVLKSLEYCNRNEQSSSCTISKQEFSKELVSLINYFLNSSEKMHSQSLMLYAPTQKHTQSKRVTCAKGRVFIRNTYIFKSHKIRYDRKIIYSTRTYIHLFSMVKQKNFYFLELSTLQYLVFNSK